jgi:ribosomal protein S27E
VTSNSENDCCPAPALAVFCRSCGSPLVQASGWTQAEEAQWKVRLWCPECWHEQSALLNKAQASYLSLAVEEGFACVLQAFEALDAIPTIEPDARRGRRPS